LGPRRLAKNGGVGVGGGGFLPGFPPHPRGGKIQPNKTNKKKT